jgi:hypothetical protein
MVKKLKILLIYVKDDYLMTFFIQKLTKTKKSLFVFVQNGAKMQYGVSHFFFSVGALNFEVYKQDSNYSITGESKKKCEQSLFTFKGSINIKHQINF